MRLSVLVCEQRRSWQKWKKISFLMLRELVFTSPIPMVDRISMEIVLLIEYGKLTRQSLMRRKRLRRRA